MATDARCVEFEFHLPCGQLSSVRNTSTIPSYWLVDRDFPIGLLVIYESNSNPQDMKGSRIALYPYHYQPTQGLNTAQLPGKSRPKTVLLTASSREEFLQHVSSDFTNCMWCQKELVEAKASFSSRNNQGFSDLLGTWENQESVAISGT